MPAGIAIPQNLAGQGKPPKGPLGLTAGTQQGQSPLPIQSQRTPPSAPYSRFSNPRTGATPAGSHNTSAPPLCPAQSPSHRRWQGFAGILQQPGQLFRRGEVEIDRHFCQPLQHLEPISDSLLQEIPGQGPLGREVYIGHAQLSPAAKNTGSKRNGALACA